MVEAFYFDGRSAMRHAAMLEIRDGSVIVRYAGGERREPCASVEVSESLAGAPRTLTFRDGAFCDVADDDALATMLAAAGYRRDPVDRWQRSWSIAAGCVVALVALAVTGYLYGLPALAEYAASKVPPDVAKHLAHQTLETLDEVFVDPSVLPAKRQAELAARFAQMRRPPGSEQVSAKIHFRSGELLGPNALALPDGAIVLIDELVKLADHDEQILAVLGHELGHGHHRHGLKAALEATILGTVMFAWVGDVSMLLATVPAAALQARYSREFEREADLFAARMMKANGIAPSRLAEMLEKLEAWVAKRKAERSGDGDADDGDEDGIESFLASHPATPKRIAAIRAMD